MTTEKRKPIALDQNQVRVMNSLEKVKNKICLQENGELYVYRGLNFKPYRPFRVGTPKMIVSEVLRSSYNLGSLSPHITFCDTPSHGFLEMVQVIEDRERFLKMRDLFPNFGFVLQKIHQP